MSYEITPDQSQHFVVPLILENWVEKTHPIRFIREFVNNLDLKSLGFKVGRVRNGRPNYSSSLLLMVWLYGYFEKIYSLRALERACGKDVCLMWLTGFQTPDHNTLGRFFRENQERMAKIFRESVQVAYHANLIGLAIQAIDGTKIVADVSKKRSLHLSDVKALLPHLDEMVKEICKEISSQNKQEEVELSAMLPEELSDRERLREAIRVGIDKSRLSLEESQGLKRTAEKELKRFEERGVEHVSITDEEAVMVKDGIRGTIDFGYNAQCVVDSQAKIITGAKVMAMASDNSNLTLMLEESEKNVGEKSVETVADGGYFSGEQLKEAEEKGYSVLVNMSEQVKGESKRGNKECFHKRNFIYDEAKDVYTCPLGEELTYEREKASKNHRSYVRIYRCRCWKRCPYAGACSSEKRGRSIEWSCYDKYIGNQIERQRKGINRVILTKRKEIVEPVFGWIKRNLNFRRWTYRGLEKVNAQWQIICTIVNLKKLYIRWIEGKLQFA